MECELVGSCGEVDEAYELVARTQPELVLLDLVLIGGTGFDVAAKVTRDYPNVRCVVISAHCSDMMVYHIHKSGLFGFIDKNNADIAEMRTAMGVLIKGHKYFSSFYQKAMLRLCMDGSAFYKILTERELEVVGLIGNTLSDEEIAKALQIAEATVGTHRRNILRKLRLDGTPKLIQYANKHGISDFIGVKTQT